MPNVYLAYQQLKIAKTGLLFCIVTEIDVERTSCVCPENNVNNYLYRFITIYFTHTYMFFKKMFTVTRYSNLPIPFKISPVPN